MHRIRRTGKREQQTAPLARGSCGDGKHRQAGTHPDAIGDHPSRSTSGTTRSAASAGRARPRSSVPVAVARTRTLAPPSSNRADRTPRIGSARVGPGSPSGWMNTCRPARVVTFQGCGATGPATVLWKLSPLIRSHRPIADRVATFRAGEQHRQQRDRVRDPRALAPRRWQAAAPRRARGGHRSGAGPHPAPNSAPHVAYAKRDRSANRWPPTAPEANGAGARIMRQPRRLGAGWTVLRPSGPVSA